MKILILHNRYKVSGGEESVVAAEAQLLKEKGHEVMLYELSNSRISREGVFGKLFLPLRVVWSPAAYRQVRKIIQKQRPAIAHVHNTFFAMSPSVYYACRDEKVPVVQTLHNYRFICPLGTLYREGKLCSECFDKGVLSSLKYNCGSKPISWKFAMLPTLKLHYLNNTFRKMIDTYIALSGFSKEQFERSGFDKNKIKIKPNFISFDPGFSRENKEYALYVGRFSPEKGADLLVKAWKDAGFLPLKVIGRGDYKMLYGYAQDHSVNAEFLGEKTNSEVFQYLKKALFLIVPSLCNENFPRIVVEAFASGVPVLASNNGALSQIIKEGKTGMLFNPLNKRELIAKAKFLCDNRDIAANMGENARNEFLAHYTANKNYEILISIYNDTLKNVLNGKERTG